MEKTKPSFKVKKIKETINSKGAKILEVFIQSGEKVYKKAVRKADYLNPGIRKGIHELWIKELKAQMTEDNEDEEELKKDKKALEDLVGTDVKGEEDYE